MRSAMGNIRTSDNCLRVSRRVALTTAALSLGTAASATIVSRARAQTKLSQPDAKYQTMPNGGRRCEGCANFQPPNGCKFVQGDISPNGWCQLFVAKS
jgi:hypothetical protein